MPITGPKLGRRSLRPWKKFVTSARSLPGAAHATELDAEAIARMDKHRFTLGGELNDEKADDTTTTQNWKGFVSTLQYD